MKLDLHVHTTFSDGSFTPIEVVAMAKQNGTQGIMIADHDECRGYNAAVQGDTHGVCVYPGIEIGAKLGGDDSQIHVLGMMVDTGNAALLSYIESAAAAREKRADTMIGKFDQAGVRITLDEVKSYCKGRIIGRPHFAAALKQKGTVTSEKEAFSRFLSRHSCCYVPLDKIEIGRAAKLIIEAGGKPVLAHPGLMSGSVRNALFPALTGLGFWGVEAYHPSHSNKECIEYECIAKQYGLYVTAGSDFHGEAKQDILIGQEQRGGEYYERSMRDLGLLE